VLIVNPILSHPGQDHGDPFVLEYLGTYYLFHTGRDGIRAYSSRDLVTWTPHGLVLGDDGTLPWAQRDFWAPEVLYRDGVFYMYVAATRRRSDGSADDEARRLGVATSSHPLGPYVLGAEPLIDAWSIDGHAFLDDDGRWWLFYNIRDETTRYEGSVIGCGNVVDEMLSPTRLAGRPHQVAFPSERWEGTRDGTWYWNEGSWALKRRDRYFQMFSGGCYRDDTYAIGVATADAPAGLWTKDDDNPLFSSAERIRGAGHHSVVLAPDGVTQYACYHGYVRGDSGRKVHLDRLHWVGDRPQITSMGGPRTRPTETPQPAPPHAPTLSPGRHWHVTAWARGSHVGLGPLTVDLPAPHDVHRRVTARRQGDNLEVRVDGLRAYAGPAVNDHRITGAGVRPQTTALIVEDATEHHLNAGDVLAWPTPGDGALDVALAVRGGAVIEVADSRAHVRTGNHGRYELVHLRTHRGRELAVRATQNETAVTDIVMTVVG